MFDFAADAFIGGRYVMFYPFDKDSVQVLVLSVPSRFGDNCVVQFDTCSVTVQPNAPNAWFGYFHKEVVGRT